MKGKILKVNRRINEWNQEIRTLTRFVKENWS